MISSFGHAPLLNRTNSGDHNLSDLAEFALPGKIERNRVPNTPRRGFTPSSINKKQQQRPQLKYFAPKNNRAEKPKGHISLSVLKEDVLNSPVPSKRVSGVYSNLTSRQYPAHRSPKPPPGSSRVLITPKSVSRTNLFYGQILPEPPLCSPRTVTDIVRVEDVSGAGWMNDCSLYSTPVFQKRLSRPVITIQSHVRRMLATKAYHAQRRNKAAVQIQRMARGIPQRKSWLNLYAGFKAAQLIQKVARGRLVRVSLRSKLAATNIQRVARGFVGRLKVRVLRLENLLSTVQSEHAKELKMIRKNKERQISKGIPSQIKKMQQEKQKKAQMATEEITELRKNNRHLREQNAQLGVHCEEMAKRNERSTIAAKQCIQHVEDLKAAVKKLEADQKKLMMLNSHFEKKLTDITQMIHRYDEMILFERKVSAIYVNTIKDHIKQINKACTDKDLANAIRNETISNIEKLQQVKACA
uniref:Uncharacterized protein n=1 Tax=Amphora coffeiformis TaxID=265554 RepID=A0A7S3KVV7_9STRA